MEIEKKSINAVFEDDLDKILEKIGLLQKMNDGELLCKFCKQVVTRDNLHSILPESGAFNVICDSPECVTKLLSHIENKNSGKEDAE